MAGCKSPRRKSLRYGDGAYSPHPPGLPLPDRKQAIYRLTESLRHMHDFLICKDA
jgi:hypothetical protein